MRNRGRQRNLGRRLLAFGSATGPTPPAVTITPSTWDGSTLPYSPSVAVSWPAPTGTPILTCVDNLTTGTNIYAGPPSTLTATDTAPASGQTNVYRVTHTYAGTAAVRSGADFTISGSSVGRFAGSGASYMALRGSFGSGGGIVGPPSHWMIDDGFRCAQALGLRCLRLYGVGSFDDPGAMYPTLGGSLNESVAVGVDYVVARAAHFGMRLIVITIDNAFGYYPGSVTSFNGWGSAGTGNFFTNPTAVANWKAFLTLLLNRVNTFTGIAYKNDPVFLAWQIGNEFNPDGQDPAWAPAIAAHLATLTAAPIMWCDSLDPVPSSLPTGVNVATRHYYPMSVANVATDAAAGAATTFPFIVDEYNWNSVPIGDPGDTLADFLTAVEAASTIRSIQAWDLCAHDPTGGWDVLADDYFPVQPGGFAVAWGKSDRQTKLLRIRQCADTITGDTTADVVPTAPLVLSASTSGITFRGAGGAVSYTFERSTAGPFSGWATAEAGVTEAFGPTAWVDPSPPAAATVVWYRAKGVSQAGASGPYSIPVAVAS